MKYSAEFLLNVAQSLVAEVAENTEQVLELAKRLRNRDKFLDSLRGAFAAGGLIGSLRNDLQLAIQLADRAAMEEKAKALEVKAGALFQLGMIELGQKNFKAAVEYFSQSLEAMPNAVTYYNIALCYLQMKGWFKDYTREAVDAFMKCIELDPTDEVAIAAGKELARLKRL